MTAAESRRVLIVEDEAITALDLATELGALGYEVCGIVDNADDALAAVVREQPNVVLMDVRLAEGGDGIDAARRICLGRDTAIVFLTAHSDEATLARALEVSPFGFVVKPFRARDLRVAIEVALAKQSKDAAAAREWHDLAATDPLTRLPNRWRLAEVLRTEWNRCRRDRVAIAALVIDVDHFKAYNDTHGHLAGDACLVAVAEAIRGPCSRPGDFLCRWGGEEFLAVLPATDTVGAARVADEMLAAVRRLQLPHGGSPTDDTLTVSIGGSTVLPVGPMGIDDVIARADRSLYAAKRGGRNRAAFDEPADLAAEQPAATVDERVEALAGHLTLVVRDLTSDRDADTVHHIDRMSRYVRLIAGSLAPARSLSDEFVRQVTLFSRLHDIGKLGIPDAILLKPDTLTAEEREVMATHVALGVRIVERAIERFHAGEIPGVNVLRNIVAVHHELLDGSGYPRGLAGEAIPLEARIVTVADIFDALTSQRIYKDSWDVDDAFATLEAMVASGKLDGDCVAALRGGREQCIAVIRRSDPAGVPGLE